MAGVPGVAYAQDVQTSLVASVGGSADTNPYSQQTTDGAGIAATAELRPSITARDELTTVNLSGYAQFRQFFRQYGLEDNYGGNADIVRRQADWLTLRGSASIAYIESGFNGFSRFGASPAGPGGTIPDPSLPTPPGSPLNPLPGLTDVSLIGQRTRFTSIGSGIGADMRLGAKSNASVDLRSSAMRYALTGLNDYNSYTGELHLNHTLGELLSVGVIGTLTKTNYIDLGQGDARTAEGLLSLDRRLGERWTLNVALGASFTKIDGRGGRPDTNFSAISTRLKFCWQGQYSNLCLGGSRSPQPAADGNVRVSTTVTADYSVRVSDRERVSVSGSYAKTGRGREIGLGAQPPVDYLSGSARYDNQLNKKLSAFVSANVSKIYTPQVRREPNVGIAVGLQVRIGTGQ